VTVRKPSDAISTDAAIVAAPEHPYVSRGAIKLAAALDHFQSDVAGRVCLDVGASTGGFTEMLLQRGARTVYAIDVGSGQLHPRLRGREAIVSLEQTDIRAVDPAHLSERPDFAVVDVSFISLKLVLPAIGKLLRSRACLIALIKPQFEAGRSDIKKGIVRDPAIHQAVCNDIAAFLASQEWRVGGCMPSPILGGDGNREFFIEAERG
jgi:23S rRNA (cytidine1920-2'-O)/16S rRNA (cytidine1409-2'-O)-methyltransferase